MNRTVLVTGGSSGIGAATATLLAQRGWRVFATSRVPTRHMPRPGPAISWLRLDLTENESIRLVAEEVLEQAGQIDALVNNAGYSEVGPLTLSDPQSVEAQFRVNTLGPLLLAQQLLPAMRAQRRGRIVWLGTVMADTPFPLLGLYSASKAAADSLHRTLGMECRRFGISTITVLPGTVRSNFDQAAISCLSRQPIDECDPYGPPVAQLRQMLIRSTARGMPPERVARRIVHALETPRPRSRYLVGAEVLIVGYGLRLLPTGMRGRLLRAPLGL